MSTGIVRITAIGVGITGHQESAPTRKSQVDDHMILEILDDY